jgi:hypothetical protein
MGCTSGSPIGLGALGIWHRSFRKRSRVQDRLKGSSKAGWSRRWVFVHCPRTKHRHTGAAGRGGISFPNTQNPHGLRLRAAGLDAKFPAHEEPFLLRTDSAATRPDASSGGESRATDVCGYRKDQDILEPLPDAHQDFCSGMPLSKLPKPRLKAFRRRIGGFGGFVCRGRE